MGKLFRSLRADEIEVRIDQVFERSCRLLLYKDARCDRRILDETFGAMNWKSDYEEIGGVLFCTVSVWDKEKQQWISKTDCGVESNQEAEKGRASDAFKRACFAWGIGRELYTRLNLTAYNLQTAKSTKNGKDVFYLTGSDKYIKFFVDELEIDEEREKITHIRIIDKNDNIVVDYTEKTPEPHKKSTVPRRTHEETYGLISDGRILCIECQAEIQDSQKKDGTPLYAMDIARVTGGLCPVCYRKHHPKKAAESNQTETTNEETHTETEE